MSHPIKVHCPRCRQNVDGVLCPRCVVPTVSGRLRAPRVRRPIPRDGEPTEVYRVHLTRIRDDGVDVEAS